MRLIAVLLCLSLTACDLLPTSSSPVNVSKEKASALAEEYAGGQANLDRTKLATLSAINAEVQMPFGSQPPPVNGLSGSALAYLVPMAATETRPFKMGLVNGPYRTGWAIILANTSELIALKLIP